jgi:hypothetical protein
MVGVGSNIGVNKGVGRGGRKGDRRGDLLHRLDLVLQRRGVGRPAGERGAVGRSRVDGVQLQVLVSVRRDLREVRCCSCCFIVIASALTIPQDRVECFDRAAITSEQQQENREKGGQEGGRSQKYPPISTYIFIGQKVGAELQIIIEIKGATGLESDPESRHRWGFRKFPHALNTTELTLGILLGHLGASTSATMVVVGMHVGGMLRVLLVVLLLVVVVGIQECRHDGRSRENPAPELNKDKRNDEDWRRGKKKKTSRKVGSWK